MRFSDIDAVRLRCIAPPHPAGPVTISMSFDGGATWLEGPWIHGSHGDIMSGTVTSTDILMINE